jgi:hypothetical protein
MGVSLVALAVTLAVALAVLLGSTLTRNAELLVAMANHSVP